MAAGSTPGREYNRRAAIIEGLRAGRSPTEIIRFFGYPISTVYDVVAKYSASEQSNESSSTPARKSHSKERTARTPAMIERTQADFGRSRTIVAKISINCECKRANNASNCRGRSSIQIIHIKDTTDPLRGCQDQASCSLQSAVVFWSKEFWPPNSSDLNPLNYYV